MVSAFYLSNVEQYLNMDGIWMDFCAQRVARCRSTRPASSSARTAAAAARASAAARSLNQGLYPMVADLKLCAGQ